MAEKKAMIDVDHMTIRFNLSSQKADNLKEYLVKLMFQEFLAISGIMKPCKGTITVNGSVAP